MRSALLSLLFAVGLILKPVSAGAVALTFGPEGPQSATEQVSVLYASRKDGSTIAVARVGDEMLDGGRISELGVPSETRDGRVLFGAQIEEHGPRSGWEILIADPNAPAADRVSYALIPLELSAGCSPAFKVDPYPVGTADGIAFIAPLRKGGDALFLYRDGRVDCLLRTGEKLDDGRAVAFLKFGSAQAASGNTLALEALLKPRRGDLAQPADKLRSHLEAILLVSPGKGTREIAVEGTSNPKHGTFGALGFPAAGETTGSEPVVAFVDRSKGAESVYVYRNATLNRLLRTGVGITFVSGERPGLGSDGTVALQAVAGMRESIVVVSHKGFQVVAQSGCALTPDSRLLSFGDPWLLDDGRVYFSAGGGSFTGFLERPANGSIRELVANGIREASFRDADERGPFVETGTLFANRRGGFTFLGGF